MNSQNRLFKLAERFARKISLAEDGMGSDQPKQAQDFFFGVGYALKTFQDSLGKLSVVDNKAVGDKSLAKLMADYFNKTQNNVSVNISVEVKPGQGARWITDITPPAFAPTAMAELNKQYQAATGKSWVAGQVAAAAAAKSAKTMEGSNTALIVDKGL